MGASRASACLGPASLNLGDGYRLACPIYAVFPDCPTGPKTCPGGSIDIPHLKEHLKRHHLCDCQSPCVNPIHITPDQFEPLRKRKRRTNGGGPLTEQWFGIFNYLFPGNPLTPAPYVPTLGKIMAVARDPPHDVRKHLETVVRQPGNGELLDTAYQSSTSLSSTLVLIDYLSRTGAQPDLSRSVEMQNNSPSPTTITNKDSPTQPLTPRIIPAIIAESQGVQDMSQEPECAKLLDEWFHLDGLNETFSM